MMMSEPLDILQTSADCSLYAIPGGSVRRFLASTPQTRAICNDPLVCGLAYTSALQKAVGATLTALAAHSDIAFVEKRTSVLHILRGGLNFGIREALGDAFQWNLHGASFLSAQRNQRADNSTRWYITEDSYRKVYLPDNPAIILGDVVATGTSLEFALTQLLDRVEKDGSQLASLLFFTIGGVRAEQILADFDRQCREKFAGYAGSTMVYFEGAFAVASAESALSVALPGTDLLRSGCVVAPEFFNSQYDSPSYPIERCTIYDAGSRAFWLPEYIEDVRTYWETVLDAAKQGRTYSELLEERFPELDAGRFVDVSLSDVAEQQLARLAMI